LAAVRHFDLGVLLVGRGEAIEAELEQHGRSATIDRDRVRIVHSPDVEHDESRPAALRRKPGASIRVAADAVAGGGHRRSSAPATEGNRDGGARGLGMLPGVDRPALPQ
jgi:fatty acid/phospholipid biosynthesis enzyme